MQIKGLVNDCMIPVMPIAKEFTIAEAFYRGPAGMIF